MLKKLYILLAGVFIINLQSCSYTKHLSEGEKLLMENQIYVNGSKGAPSAASNILKQQPNSGVWVLGNFWSIPLGVYNWGDGSEDGFWSKIGDPPVVLDSVLTERSTRQLQIWYFNHGYFNARATSNEELVHNNPAKSRVIYHVETGRRYYIDSIQYGIDNRQLYYLVKENEKNRMVKSGDPYDTDRLDDERERLAQIFRNNGFYDFKKNFIVFEADTFMSGDSVDIRMLITPTVTEFRDSVIYNKHKPYTISKVIIRPDKDYGNPNPPGDTVHYLGYMIAYDSLAYKPRYITDAIHFRPGDIYNQKEVRETYAHLVGYNGFKLTEITFRPDLSDSTNSSLMAIINLSPEQKRTIIIEPEGTYTSGNFGVRGNLGYTSRNLFKGGEELNILFSAGYERQPTTTSAEFTPTFEITGETNIKFPRFLLPFNTVGLLPKRMQPSSTIGLSVGWQRRAEFARLTAQTGLSYRWRESLKKTHQINLIDFTHSRIDSLNPDFYAGLNLIQRRAFQSELIAATRYTFIFNEQVDPRLTNFRYLRSTVELAGNFLDAFDQLTGLGETNASGARELLGVQYFQFGKADVDARYFWNLGRKRAWVNRVFSGYIRPWGNSKFETDSGAVRIPPFSRYYFMGGGNDVRGWPTYRLGPGKSGNTDYYGGRDTAFATGTFKLLINSEYRFRIISSLNGAVFVDAGNIWNTGGIETEDTKLTWEGLYKELAISSGAGLRLDLDFFVIRFDVGMKVRDPGLLDLGDQWVLITRPVFPNLSYHFALGYPF